MQVVFFGTPAFAVPSLRALLDEGLGVQAVVTQTDKPKGRSRSVFVPPPVKTEAEALGLPVLQPERPAGDLFAASLKRYAPDLGVVVAYGHLIPKTILEIPRQGMINVHASLLPRHRGASPIQAAILAGDRTTGITIMRMGPGLDTGPILHSARTPIGECETAGELTERLGALGAKTLVEAISMLKRGGLVSKPQDDTLATLAPKLNRAAGRISWQATAEEIARRIRAFDPSPGAWTTLDSLDVKLFRPSLVAGNGEPGRILAVDRDLVIGTGGGRLAVGEIQPAGRRRMTIPEWMRGAGSRIGESFR